MAAVQWIKIIIAILELIEEGADKQTAVSRVAQRFGVSESSIWNHGGFQEEKGMGKTNIFENMENDIMNADINENEKSKLLKNVMR